MKRARNDDPRLDDSPVRGDGAWHELHRTGLCEVRDAVSPDWVARAAAFVESLSPCVKYGIVHHNPWFWRAASAGPCATPRCAGVNATERPVAGGLRVELSISRKEACFSSERLLSHRPLETLLERALGKVRSQRTLLR